MLITFFLALFLSAFAYAEDLRWVFANVAWIDHWNDMVREPCFDMLEEIANSEPVTILVPFSDAAERFRKNPEWESYTPEMICDLVKYHTIVGGYSTDDFATSFPFLQTFLGKTGKHDGQYLQVDKVADLSKGQGVNFYSGLRRKASTWFGDYPQAEGVYLHAIDEVLTPPLSFADTAHAAGLTSAVMAATKANLDWWTENPATYFIPTNQAFQDVGSAINSASDEKLRDILSYHYLNRTRDPIFTATMYNGNVSTANGEKIFTTLSQDDRTFSINSASIKQHNIIVKDGVMHVIDQVLNPDNPASRQDNPSPFGMRAFPNATRSGAPPFANMLTQKSPNHLEPGQPRERVPWGGFIKPQEEEESSE